MVVKIYCRSGIDYPQFLKSKGVMKNIVLIVLTALVIQGCISPGADEKLSIELRAYRDVIKSKDISSSDLSEIAKNGHFFWTFFILANPPLQLS